MYVNAPETRIQDDPGTGLIPGTTNPLMQADHPHPNHASPSRPAQRAIPSPPEIAYVTAETRELRGEVERLRAERERMVNVQQEIMQLLGTKNPDKILHDLRN